MSRSEVPAEMRCRVDVNPDGQTGYAYCRPVPPEGRPWWWWLSSGVFLAGFLYRFLGESVLYAVYAVAVSVAVVGAVVEMVHAGLRRWR